MPAICPPERPLFDDEFWSCSAPCEALVVLDEVGEEDEDVDDARTGRK